MLRTSSKTKGIVTTLFFVTAGSVQADDLTLLNDISWTAVSGYSGSYKTIGPDGDFEAGYTIDWWEHKDKPCQFQLIQRDLNKDLKLFGILLTMFDKRTNLSYQVAEEAEKYFNDLVFKTMIPRNIRLSEAPSFGKPVLFYDATSIGARNYIALAKETLRNNQRYLKQYDEIREEASPTMKPNGQDDTVSQSSTPANGFTF